ncbi:hypothetical protein [Streptomyces sp. NPDC051909]|uniref:hypothetical protein n=1 Tax=Streptomyces sp. NPDC051909 TaxID=3154944 RepID=UPI00342F374F
MKSLTRGKLVTAALGVAGIAITSASTFPAHAADTAPNGDRTFTQYARVSPNQNGYGNHFECDRPGDVVKYLGHHGSQNPAIRTEFAGYTDSEYGTGMGGFYIVAYNSSSEYGSYSVTFTCGRGFAAEENVTLTAATKLTQKQGVYTTQVVNCPADFPKVGNYVWVKGPTGRKWDEYYVSWFYDSGEGAEFKILNRNLYPETVRVSLLCLPQE